MRTKTRHVGAIVMVGTNCQPIEIHEHFTVKHAQRTERIVKHRDQALPWCRTRMPGVTRTREAAALRAYGRECAAESGQILEDSCSLAGRNVHPTSDGAGGPYWAAGPTQCSS